MLLDFGGIWYDLTIPFDIIVDGREIVVKFEVEESWSLYVTRPKQILQLRNGSDDLVEKDVRVLLMASSLKTACT